MAPTDIGATDAHEIHIYDVVHELKELNLTTGETTFATTTRINEGAVLHNRMTKVELGSRLWNDSILGGEVVPPHRG